MHSPVLKAFDVMIAAVTRICNGNDSVSWRVKAHERVRTVRNVSTLMFYEDTSSVARRENLREKNRQFPYNSPWNLRYTEIVFANRRNFSLFLSLFL